MNTLLSSEVRRKSKIDWRKGACTAVLFIALAVILVLAVPAAAAFVCISAVWTLADKIISWLEKPKSDPKA